MFTTLCVYVNSLKHEIPFKLYKYGLDKIVQNSGSKNSHYTTLFDNLVKHIVKQPLPEKDDPF